MSLLVGICGGSGSGKSTLAAELVQRWRERRGHGAAAVLSFDLYYHDQSHRPPSERAQLNYDHPDSLDADLLVQHLGLLRAGRSVTVPGYDFATYRRTGAGATISPAEVIVVEGILLFAFASLRRLLDVLVFRDCPEEIRFQRRLARDVTERGRTPELVAAQFAATVKPMHDRYVQPHRADAHLVTEHGQDLASVVAGLVEHLHSLIGPGTLTR